MLVVLVGPAVVVVAPVIVVVVVAVYECECVGQYYRWLASALDLMFFMVDFIVHPQIWQFAFFAIFVLSYIYCYHHQWRRL